MDSIIIIVIVAVAALVIGLIAGKLIFSKNIRNLIEEAKKSRKHKQEAERIRKEAILHAENEKEKKKLEAQRAFSSTKIRTRKICITAKSKTD
jgi:hypothetical protein